MLKIHLDTDIGGDIDDLCALVYLLKNPNVEIVGITTVGDDGGKRAGFVKYILKLAGKENIPVLAGADVKNHKYRVNFGIQNKKYWPKNIISYPNEEEKAIELLKKNIEQDATIIGIGPFTNFYLVEKKYSGILNRAKLFLVGGFVFPIRKGFPNWGNNMDFNVQVDVRSSRFVLKNSSPTLIPLSVTSETFLRKKDLKKLESGDELQKLIAKQSLAFSEDEKYDEVFGKTCKNLPNDFINFQHDSLACAIATGFREKIEMKKLPLVFEEKDGWLVEKVDKNGKFLNIVTKIDGEEFNKHWLNAVS